GRGQAELLGVGDLLDLLAIPQARLGVELRPRRVDDRGQASRPVHARPGDVEELDLDALAILAALADDEGAPQLGPGDGFVADGCDQLVGARVVAEGQPGVAEGRRPAPRPLPDAPPGPVGLRGPGAFLRRPIGVLGSEVLPPLPRTLAAFLARLVGP